MKEILLGAHVSISGGLYKAIERGEEIGCTAIQIFTKNSNRWYSKELTKEEIKTFIDTKNKSKIKMVVAHDSYLINLASPNEELRKKSINAFIDEIKRCSLLEIPYLIMHPGAYTDNGTEEIGMKNILDSFKMIFDSADFNSNVKILLETTAGQGSTLGYKFEQLAEIIEKSGKNNKYFDICLDTCHILASGYDIRTYEAYNETIEKFDKILGLDKLKVIHINDSKKGVGSKIDRHEHIGEGIIGLEAFKLIMNDKRLNNCAKILETPDDGDNKQHKKNLDILLSLVE